MGSGMYTAPRRVTRDGVLVCFEGERMTRDDAERRGLLTRAVSDPGARRAELMHPRCSRHWRAHHWQSC